MKQIEINVTALVYQELLNQGYKHSDIVDAMSPGPIKVGIDVMEYDDGVGIMLYKVGAWQDRGGS